MRPIATDAAWSVCLSVGHNRQPYKKGLTNRDVKASRPMCLEAKSFGLGLTLSGLGLDLGLMASGLGLIEIGLVALNIIVQ